MKNILFIFTIICSMYIVNGNAQNLDMQHQWVEVRLLDNSNSSILGEVLEITGKEIIVENKKLGIISIPFIEIDQIKFTEKSNTRKENFYSGTIGLGLMAIISLFDAFRIDSDFIIIDEEQLKRGFEKSLTFLIPSVLTTKFIFVVGRNKTIFKVNGELEKYQVFLNKVTR